MESEAVHNACVPVDQTDVCDICWKKDGKLGLRLLRCRQCRLCVHEECYGYAPTNKETKEFLCLACASVGSTVKARERDKDGKRREFQITERPTDCCLCNVDDGLEAPRAMHPLFDDHGIRGRHVILPSSKGATLGQRRKGKHPVELPERTAWVHTVCASALASKGFSYGVMKNGKFGDGEEDPDRKVFDDDSVNSALEYTGDEPFDETTNHHFVLMSSRWYGDNNREVRQIKQHQEDLKCEVCGKKDNGTFRIALQCYANDKEEFKELRGKHKGLGRGEDCYQAMHIGCAFYGHDDFGNYWDHRRVFFHAGTSDGKYGDALFNCFCKIHAEGLQQRRMKGKTRYPQRPAQPLPSGRVQSSVPPMPLVNLQAQTQQFPLRGKAAAAMDPKRRLERGPPMSRRPSGEVRVNRPFAAASSSQSIRRNSMGQPSANSKGAGAHRRSSEVLGNRPSSASSSSISISWQSTNSKETGDRRRPSGEVPVNRPFAAASTSRPARPNSNSQPSTNSKGKGTPRRPSGGEVPANLPSQPSTNPSRHAISTAADTTPANNSTVQMRTKSSQVAMRTAAEIAPASNSRDQVPANSLLKKGTTEENQSRYAIKTAAEAVDDSPADPGPYRGKTKSAIVKDLVSRLRDGADAAASKAVHHTCHRHWLNKTAEWLSFSDFETLWKEAKKDAADRLGSLQRLDDEKEVHLAYAIEGLDSKQSAMVRDMVEDFSTEIQRLDLTDDSSLQNVLSKKRGDFAKKLSDLPIDIFKLLFKRVKSVVEKTHKVKFPRRRKRKREDLREGENSSSLQRDDLSLSSSIEGKVENQASNHKRLKGGVTYDSQKNECAEESKGASSNDDTKVERQADNDKRLPKGCEHADGTGSQDVSPLSVVDMDQYNLAVGEIMHCVKAERHRPLQSILSQHKPVWREKLSHLSNYYFACFWDRVVAQAEADWHHFINSDSNLVDWSFLVSSDPISLKMTEQYLSDVDLCG